MVSHTAVVTAKRATAALKTIHVIFLSIVRSTFRLVNFEKTVFQAAGDMLARTFPPFTLPVAQSLRPLPPPAERPTQPASYRIDDRPGMSQGSWRSSRNQERTCVTFLPLAASRPAALMSCG